MPLAVLLAVGAAGCSRIAYTPTFSVGGTVAGLAGTGVTLQLNGGSSLTLNTNGPFAFGTRLAIGDAYNVGVLTQPTNPNQICTVTAASGTMGPANVEGVSVICTPAFTIGGDVSGLVGTGLILQNNGASNLAISANGAFTFGTAIVSGAGFNVTVLAQPANPTQTCAVTNGAGTVAGADVTNVGVVCTGDAFTILSLADPLATQQWHLKNTGQNAFADDVGVSGIDINVEPVFSNFGFTGADVIVAVVDTGLEIAHEDLAANVVPDGSWDFNNNDTDPTSSVIDGDHGTSVSGLIAMARNGLGGIGVAPRARLKGFNFLSSDQQGTKFVDSLGGSPANPKSDDVFVFNQSFGIDFGMGAADDFPIDPAEEAQYLAGVTSLRGGKGALYVKAAGNGFDGPCGNTGVSCENANFDPSNTFPFQIVAGAINANGIKASYSTAGSAIWVSAPGGEFGRNAALAGGAGTANVEPAMVTTDQSTCAIGFATNPGTNGSFFDNGGAPNTLCNYTNGMNGTSSATPVTAGAIALILEANPALTWRDVKHILASTARQIDAGRAAVTFTLTDGNYVAEPAWTTNAAGFKFHNGYGFGLVDASAAVNTARTYNPATLGTFTDTGFISSGAISVAIPDNSVAGASSSVSVPANPVSVIEAVQIRVSLTHPFTGDLAVELTSPSGTRSVLKNGRDQFLGSDDLSNMVLLSNAFYGEDPAGSWTIRIVDTANADIGTLTNWAIRVYGH
ncbi:MAG: S8 family peptidase [Burkholderiales bacterium]